MVKKNRLAIISVALAVFFSFANAKAGSSDYLNAEQVRERVLGQSYYQLWYVDVDHDKDLTGLDKFTFHTDGRLEWQLFAKKRWREDLEWKIKPDGRLCMPNKKGKTKCRFVRVKDDYLHLFNKRGEFRFKLSPHSHGR